MKLLLNVTFVPEKELFEDFVNWARIIYIPAAADFSFGERPRFLLVPSVEETAEAFAIQFVVDGEEKAREWIDSRVPAMVQLFTEAHPQFLLPYFATVMIVMDEE